jgi:organic hydroperoxide reductase OsmC/OhrA
MINYPISFTAEVKAGPEIDSPWEASAGEFSTSCSIPPEFAGSGGAPSPEDFYLLALSNCFVATFKVFANASKLSFESIDLKSHLEIDQDSPGKASAKSCMITVSLNGVENTSRASMIMKKVSTTGILLNSVKSQLKFEFLINGEPIS